MDEFIILKLVKNSVFSVYLSAVDTEFPMKYEFLLVPL